MSRGIYGGTFDPVHKAHLSVAEEVRKRLRLDEVIFMPAGKPWLKAGRLISPASDRVEMVRLAIASNHFLKFSTIEIERKGPTYSIDTIRELRLQKKDSELYFIMGWDNFNGLPKWREPEKLIELCTLVIVPRPGYPEPNLKDMETALPGISQKVILLDNPKLDISASDIRRRVAAGLPIDQFVPEAVEKYIKEHRLYLEAEEDQ